MATVVDIDEAAARLTELVARAERGEEIVVARSGMPIVRLTPVAAPRRRFGSMRLHVPDEFFEPLTGEELTAWE